MSKFVELQFEITEGWEATAPTIPFNKLIGMSLSWKGEIVGRIIRLETQKTLGKLFASATVNLGDSDNVEKVKEAVAARFKSLSIGVSNIKIVGEPPGGKKIYMQPGKLDEALSKVAVSSEFVPDIPRRWRETVSIDDTIGFLNELLKIDKAAINSLMNSRVECNEELAKHPTVQVGSRNRIMPPYPGGNIPGYDVGLLGIFNGLFGINEARFGPIVAVIDDNTRELIEFRRTTARDWERKPNQR